MQIYGIVGYIASGKGAVAERIAREKGAHYMKLSDILREALIKRWIDVDRDNLTIFGNNLRKQAGADILAELTFWRAIRSKYKKVVIDGIRNPAEIDFFRGEAETVIIAVHASYEKRLERYLARSVERSEDPALTEAFFKQNQIEQSTDDFGQNLPECIKMADYVVNNEGKLEDLDGEVLKALNFIRDFKTLIEGQHDGPLDEETRPSSYYEGNSSSYEDEGDDPSSSAMGNGGKERR
jgi:dephospho-CoA kinase